MISILYKKFAEVLAAPFCAFCKGLGKIRISRTDGKGEVTYEAHTCRFCNGTGKQRKDIETPALPAD